MSRDQFQKGRHAFCTDLRSWLHLWIAGFQGPQAKPFKAGHDFAAVNAAKRSRGVGYGSAGPARSQGVPG